MGFGLVIGRTWLVQVVVMVVLVVAVPTMLAVLSVPEV